MKTLLSVMAIAGFVLLADGPARADDVAPFGSPCCASKPCPAGKTVVKGNSPSEAKCCTDPNNAATCTSTPNAGYACDFPGLTGVGCIDGPADPATCAGGDASVPAGCICAAGTCTSGTPEGCTEDAVAACCAADACH